MKTLFYLLGMLAVAYTDFSDPRLLYSVWLPLIDFCFLVFLWFELLLYFSLFSYAGDGQNVYEMLRSVFHLQTDARQIGWPAASFALALSLLDAILLFTALIFVATRIIDLAT